MAKKTIRQSLRGRSDFVSDIYIKGMLYGATVRSPYPHAWITDIDAGAVPDDITIVTAADIRGQNEIVIGDESMPVLARERCVYAGEPVALLAGRNQREVTEAARLLRVDYEEIPAVLSFPAENASQEIHVVNGSRGNADEHLAESHQVVEGTYRTGVQEHMYNEPQGAIANPGGDGSLAVHCATQWPYHVQQCVIHNLPMKASECEVIATDTGVDLDGKLWYPSLVATHASLLAMKAGKPVKLVYSNLEDFKYTSKRAPVCVTHLTGIDEEGRIQAAKIDISYNCGAYPLFTAELTERLAATALGIYGCDHTAVTVRVIRTNLPPLNVLSGFGTASTHFAAQTHVSRIIELAGADPAAWRASASVHGSGPFHAHAGGFEAAVREVARKSDFSRKSAAYELQKKRREDSHGASVEIAGRGVGLAVAAEGNGFVGSRERLYQSAVSVRLDTDGTATLSTSTVPRTRGLREYWVHLAAEGLGLKPENVRIVTGRTGVTPDSGPSTLSRSILISGRLITQACATIQKKRFRNPLPLEVRRSFRVPKSAGWDVSSLSGQPFPYFSLGAVVVEVSVNPVTFKTHVENVWMSVDAGRIADEAGALRSLEMGVYQALEWATHEKVRYRNGQIDGRTYLSYRETVRPALPGVHITLLPSKMSEPRGIGSLPYNCVPAALAAAVSQATGRYMDQIPTNPELIHGYMESE